MCEMKVERDKRSQPIKTEKFNVKYSSFWEFLHLCKNVHFLTYFLRKQLYYILFAALLERIYAIE